MADETGDDGLTQRERRALRHRATRAKRAPVDWARRAKVVRAPAIVLLVIAAGAGAIVWLNSQGGDCPDHWHATFGVFAPEGQQGSYDIPNRIDWNAAKTASGKNYYTLGNNPGMSISVHMHQDNGPEQGSAALGPAQFHFEPPAAKCVGMQTAFSAIDVDLTSTHLALKANTPLAQTNAAFAGPFDNNGNHTLHFYLESRDSSGQWVWSERNLGDYLHYQLHNGESALLAFGHYNDLQIKDMESQIPAPISRPLAPVVAAAPSSTTAATNSTPT